MEKRKFPRKKTYLEQRILKSKYEDFEKVHVISQDLSASGISFRSLQNYKVGSLIVIHLDEGSCEDLQMNKAKVVKSGKYTLAKVLRVDEDQNDKGVYQVACSFLSLDESDQAELELFNDILNRDTVEKVDSL